MLHFWWLTCWRCDPSRHSHWWRPWFTTHDLIWGCLVFLFFLQSNSEYLHFWDLKLREDYSSNSDVGAFDVERRIDLLTVLVFFTIWSHTDLSVAGVCICALLTYEDKRSLHTFPSSPSLHVWASGGEDEFDWWAAKLFHRWPRTSHNSERLFILLVQVLQCKCHVLFWSLSNRRIPNFPSVSFN